MGLYHMWVILAGPPEAIIFRGTHLLFAIVLVFLIYGPKVDVQRDPTAIDYAWLVAGAASLLYLFINYEYVVTRIYYIDELTSADMIFGTILLVVVTEATRRASICRCRSPRSCSSSTGCSSPGSSRCACSTSST